MTAQPSATEVPFYGIGTTTAHDARHAVDELREQLPTHDLSGILFFCSSQYDLEKLGREIQGAFPCPVVGCTSSGQIGPKGFQKCGIAALGFRRNVVQLEPHLISPLGACEDLVVPLASKVAPAQTGARVFGLILVDGLALMEERLAAALYRSVGDVPIIGGSAGDDLKFERTAVYHEGRFQSDAALFVVCRTARRFTAFKLQHFIPSETLLVITAAEPRTRTVKEINGEPAVRAYSRAIGVQVSELDANVFSAHPLVLELGGDAYVRSIARANADGSLTMFCAIDEGLVLSAARSLDPAKCFERALDNVAHQIGPPELVIGCDCILRRLELEHRGLDGQLGQLLSRHRVFGFSTYGEQFNAVHVNQTFTGVALGADDARAK
ncbi:MAG: FIST N-terminal domain-containing protein [Myxococcota bacterium]